MLWFLLILIIFIKFLVRIFQEVDLVAMDLTITHPRQKVVDFSYPFYFENYGILIQMPNRDSHKLWTIVRLFKPTVWLTILFSLIFGVMYIRLLHKLIFDSHQSGLNTIYESSWYIFSGMVNQGMQACRVFINFCCDIIHSQLSHRTWLINLLMSRRSCVSNKALESHHYPID